MNKVAKYILNSSQFLILTRWTIHNQSHSAIIKNKFRNFELFFPSFFPIFFLISAFTWKKVFFFIFSAQNIHQMIIKIKATFCIHSSEFRQFFNGMVYFSWLFKTTNWTFLIAFHAMNVHCALCSVSSFQYFQIITNRFKYIISLIKNNPVELICSGKKLDEN